ncbi:alanine racemase [Patescibacteria group bacterium]|nr:alanine racemase [Patescibacteria group bacterium]
MLSFLKKKYRTLNTVEIFESALIHNLNLFKKLVPRISVCPVLKSNAYGFGLTEVAKILEKQNPEFFVVDSLYEAYKLKKARIHTPILILGYTLPENLRIKRLPFHFTVSDLATARKFQKLKNPIHIELDTGMGRMGFKMETFKNNLKELREINLNIQGIFTHFADADNPDNTYTKTQYQLFEDAIKLCKEEGFNPKWIHSQNSAAALKLKSPYLNMMRLGLSLYGISPYQESDEAYEFLTDLKPALEVKSTLILVKNLQKGEKVSYGCTFTAPHDMKIGVVPFGYYEGIPIALSNKGYLQVKGEFCPILGRVCMNHTMIDLKKIDAKIGDEVIIYSKDPEALNSFTSSAKFANTIPYELMVRLSESTRREVN